MIVRTSSLAWIASLALAWPQSAPASGDPSTAPASPAQENAGVAPVPAPVDLQLDVDLPLRNRLRLDENGARALRDRMAVAAKRLSRNVVQITVERAPSAEPPLTLEVSGLILDPIGHVVTFGSALSQAERIAVRFVNQPAARPRRAALLGTDPESDVGLLSVGPVDVDAVKLGAPAGAAVGVVREGTRIDAEAPPRDPVGRVVFSLWGVRGGESPFSLGVQEPGGPVGPPGGSAMFFRVSVVRRPEALGGIVAGPDGKVMGILLAPAFTTMSDPSLHPMLALSATTRHSGVTRVMQKVDGSGLQEATFRTGRAWIGLGASDLVEAEFLKQLDVQGAVVVDEIFEASPALAAGIEPHDLLLRWDEHPLRNVEDLSAALSAATPGTHIALECVRRLVRRKVDVTLAAW